MEQHAQRHLPNQINHQGSGGNLLTSSILQRFLLIERSIRPSPVHPPINIEILPLLLIERISHPRSFHALLVVRLGLSKKVQPVHYRTQHPDKQYTIFFQPDRSTFPFPSKGPTSSLSSRPCFRPSTPCFSKSTSASLCRG